MRHSCHHLLAAALICAFCFMLAGCQTDSAAPRVTSVRGQNLEKGRKLFTTRCIECHVLPSINRYPRAAWPRLVAKMSGRADLTPADGAAIVAYILAAHER